ncbi:hypothetical protein NFI96_004566, partial [Prochilodus magdalenae]
MPKMEKRRPPENKRSRKPAHPVKREVSQELKNFAESTMNELLGWYGYDKLDLQDPEASDIRSFSNRARRHHVSVLKDNTSLSTFTLSSSSAKYMFLFCIILEEQQNIPIVCVWCQREGQKHYSLIMGSELKSFCSEKCFAMCRRAYFKRNKARDEDQESDQSPPSPGQTGETPPRLMLKMNSNTRVCDWCKHVRHTKYLDFGAGEERLQFCSTKCLNQYKMDIFYREAQAALITTTTSSSPSHPEKESHLTTGENQTLLTPQSWDNSFLEGERQAPSPKEAPTPVLSSVASVLRSSSVKPLVAVQHQKEREILGLSQLHSGRPVPQIAAGQPCVHQNPPSFLQPPLHAQGLHSPVHQPPQNPASSPIQIPLHQSPQLQTPSIRSLRLPHLLYPHTGSVLPIASTYRHPAPPPCPQPTVLVPYPIIIPLPVPVPIPIPIPLSSGVSGHSNINKNCDKKEEKGTEITLITPEDLAKEKIPEHTGIILHSLVKHTVKAEKFASPPDSCIFPFSSLTSHSSSIHPEPSVSPNLSVGHLAEHREEGRECQVIQRVFYRHLVKQEPKSQVKPALICEKHKAPVPVRRRITALVRAPARARRRSRTKRQRGRRAGVLCRTRKWCFNPPLPSILLANVQSLENKIDELNARIKFQRDIESCCVLALTETWLSAATPNTGITPAGFSIYRQDRTLDSVKVRPYFPPRDFSSVILTTVYIPPQAEKSLAFKALYETISRLENSHPEVVFIVVGDFNKANPKMVLPKYYQHINFPTRGEQILNHRYTALKDSYKPLPRPAFGKADHTSILLLPAYRQRLKQAKPALRSVYQWSEEAIFTLQDCFESTNWQMFRDAAGADINENTDSITSYISKCTDDTVPKINVRTFPNQKPWINNEVVRSFKAVNPRKTPGPDGVHNRVLRACTFQLAEVFTDIFNLSLRLSAIPTCFKRTTIALTVHSALTHLDRKNTYVRMLFIDYSSAFNTIIAAKLIPKLTDLGLNPHLCNWVLDFLTEQLSPNGIVFLDRKCSFDQLDLLLH